jgi:uncharacterized protein YgiM (DUF1202 family)
MNRNLMSLGIALLAPALLAATMHVQVRNGQVRERPSFMGRIVANLAYGQTVDAVATQGDWTQVRLANGQSGWMSNSTLTTKHITVKQTTGAVQTGASADDLALAGKGFSADIEAEFKKQNRNISFAPVDKMEKMKASPVQIQAFIAQGGLKQSGRR